MHIVFSYQTQHNNNHILLYFTYVHKKESLIPNLTQVLYLWDNDGDSEKEVEH